MGLVMSVCICVAISLGRFCKAKVYMIGALGGGGWPFDRDCTSVCAEQHWESPAQILQSKVEALGYDGSYEAVKTLEYGLPQSRRRMRLMFFKV